MATRDAQAMGIKTTWIGYTAIVEWWDKQLTAKRHVGQKPVDVPWSPAAYEQFVTRRAAGANLEAAVRGLVHEHVVPIVTVVDLIIEHSSSPEGTLALLLQYGQRCVITTAEDKVALGGAIHSRMPAGWAHGGDVWCRYSAFEDLAEFVVPGDAFISQRGDSHAPR